MSELNPELRSAVDNVWIEQAKNEMRIRITKNLQLIEDGYFSEEELSFALTVEEFPLVIVEDEELGEIIRSGDVNAWNQYIAAHPEVNEQSYNELRLAEVRGAALDRQAVLAYPELPPTEAIEAVLEASSEEIAEEARFNQSALQAAARAGFAI